ncbi:uncharacterized protein LOC114739017 [Neltuma alba]|uniref:uncharacterized protein LOC114722939 n=1 Tax=Neltuma alba TaxID=207710 RepID=UPI0010A513B6|nr:uncharacterized protein LOC114722939 [Prosopis alba]XP_028782912.1 uncharacterized protein LOC114739017 [Prosopis alba]
MPSRRFDGQSFFFAYPWCRLKKGGEVNMTLGGIDLKNSGSVVVREVKKLLTVLFPDGHDGMRRQKTCMNGRQLLNTILNILCCICMYHHVLGFHSLLTARNIIFR